MAKKKRGKKDSATNSRVVASKNKFNLVKKDIMNYLNWSYNYLETRKTI